MKGKKTAVFRDILHNYNELKEASDLIKNGGTVVFPTETVYGLGADAYNSEAVRKIFLAKGRPPDNPLITHIADIDDLHLTASDIPAAAYFLFEKFSPGPLTLILKKNDRISDLATAGLSTVAVRIPSHAAARALIKSSGVPIAAPSANRSGRPSPTTFDMTMTDMDGRVDAVIDGGDCEIGLESTVILIKEKSIGIVRPGAVTEEMIERSIESLPGYKIMHSYLKKKEPVSPGMKYIHYKPKAEVYLSLNADIDKITGNFPGKKVGVISIGDVSIYRSKPEVLSFGTLGEYARGLYKSFTMLDGLGCDIIVAQTVEQKGLGRAIMNRLNKASGGKTI